jgi:predicted RecA/RadA family phage recombinase
MTAPTSLQSGPQWADGGPHFGAALAGEAISAGDAVAIGASGEAWKACAGSGREEIPCVGFAQTTVALGEYVQIVNEGLLANLADENAAALAPGAPYYLSNTAGKISASAGNTSQVLGVAKDANTLQIGIKSLPAQVSHRGS